MTVKLLGPAPATPSTQAFGDAAAAGTSTSPALDDHKHAMPANPTGLPLALAGAVSATRYVGGTATVAPTTGTFAVGDYVVAQNGTAWVCTVAGSPGTWVQLGSAASFATPSIRLGTAAAGGAAATTIRSDATIAAFDATAPSTSAVGDAAATGSATVAARRDHLHGREQLYDDNVLAPWYADFEDTTLNLAFGGVNANTAVTTAQAESGTNSMSLSSVASGDMSFITNTYGLGVGFAPGATVTAMASFRAAVSPRSVKVGIAWKQANGATISTTFGTIVADTTSGWTQATCTAVAPALTFAAEVVAYVIGTGAASEVHYIDELSLAHGTATTWLPGTGTFPYTAAPTASAVGDAAAVGSATLFARGDHKHGREAFATNSVALGTAAAAGSASTLIRSDATIAAFDATVPTSSAPADAAAVGSATVAARRDHKHGREAQGPLGTQGSSWFARVTSSQGPTAPPFDITSATVTVTLVSGRRYRISAQALITSSVATDATQLGIMEDGTAVMLANSGTAGGGNAAGSVSSSVVRACPGDVTAGSHTYKLNASRNGGGTGNFTNNAGTTFPTWIMIEDVGT